MFLKKVGKQTLLTYLLKKAFACKMAASVRAMGSTESLCRAGVSCLNGTAITSLCKTCFFRTNHETNVRKQLNCIIAIPRNP